MARFKKIYTDEQKDEVINLFNRTELREGELIIDNRSSKIAKELSYPTAMVDETISEYLNLKIDKINSKNIC